MGVFNRGYQGVREEKERQETERAKRQNSLWRFFLSKDGDEARIRFLTEEPVTFYEHNVKTSRNGKEAFDSVTCAGENCSFCDNGDRPSFKGAFLIIDRREYEYKDKDGKKKTGKNQLRLYVQGTRVLSQLDRISSRYGLSKRDVSVVRLGSGTSTTYSFEREEESKMTKQEIEQILPENMRSKYDGTMESLYAIVEEQIALSTDSSDSSASSKDDDDEDETPKSKRNVIVRADEDDDDDDDDDTGNDSVPQTRGNTKAVERPTAKPSLFKRK